MSGYIILARPTGGNSEVEICRVGNNPDAIVEAIRNKSRSIKESDSTKRIEYLYEHVHAEPVP